MKNFGTFLSLAWRFVLLGVFTTTSLHAQKLDTLRMEFGRYSSYSGFYFSAKPGTYHVYWNGTKETVTFQSAVEDMRLSRSLSGDKNTVLLCATEASGQITKFRPYSSNVTGIDVSGCPALVTLDCFNTKITTLDASNLTKLDTLKCPNTLTALDVSGCTTLRFLSCSSPSLTTLDVSTLTNLTSLNVSSTKLTTLDVSNLTHLTNLTCNSTLLTDINMSGCTALSFLNCASTPITSLEISGLTNLTTLNCSYTKLTDLDISGLTNLKTAQAFSNSRLTTIRATGCTALSRMDCHGEYSNRPLKSLDVSGCTSLDTLYCYYSALTALDVSDCKALKRLDCYESPLEVLYISDCNNLKYLNCNKNNLSFLNLSGCKALISLYCFNSPKLTELDLTHNPALKTVNCYNSAQLTTLNLTGCTVLENLHCNETKLKTLDLSTNNALQRLDIYKIPSLTDLDLSQHTALTTLNCYDNSNLVSLNLTDCTGLTTLNAYYNRSLPNLDLSTCSALITYEGYGNTKLTELNLSGCKALTTMRCNDNTSLSSLNLSGCESLVLLAVANSRLQDLDLSPCPDFRELYCHGSQFTMQTLSELAPQTKIAALSPQTIRKTLLAGETLDIRDELSVNNSPTSCAVYMQKSGDAAAPEYYTIGEGEDYGLISLKKLDSFRVELKNTAFVNKDGKTIDPVVVNYVVRVIGIPERLDKPAFSVKAGAIAKGTKVSLSCPFVDAKIYYTLDESDPTEQSQLYEKPITIREDMVIRAIAILGPVKSEIAEAEYTVNLDIPEAPEFIATPTFSVPGGAVERGTLVEISCETKAVRIYYTLDGSNPTAGSREYKEPIVINAAGTLKALAVSNSMMSDIASTYYTIIGEDPNAPVVAAPVFSLADGEVEKGTTVSLSCATEGAKIYYRADGSDPSDQSWEYTSPIVINSDVTIRAIAIIEHLTSEITTATYTLKTEDPNAPKAVETPVFSHPSGAVEAGTEVSLSCATQGAQIYYTLDGSTPTKRSLKYKNPIVINDITTIKAIAFKGNDNSLEAMAIYTLFVPEMPADSSAVATPTFSHPTGEVKMGTTVSLSCATKGAQIYYTLDGSAPTRRSLKYKYPISIYSTTLVKAVAIKGNEVSLEAMAVYTVPTANESESVLANVCVYPNPNSGICSIDLPVAATIEVLSANGMPMQRIEAGAGTHTLHITQSGLYILRITAENATNVQRVMVR